MTTDDGTNRFDLQRLTALVAELSKLLPAVAVPTVSAYMPKVLLAASPGQLRRYRVHWARAVEALGAQPIDEVKPSDVSALRQRATRQAQARSNERKGRYAGESAVRAMRMFSDSPSPTACSDPTPTPPCTYRYPVGCPTFAGH